MYDQKNLVTVNGDWISNFFKRDNLVYIGHVPFAIEIFGERRKNDRSTLVIPIRLPLCHIFHR